MNATVLHARDNAHDNANAPRNARPMPPKSLLPPSPLGPPALAVAQDYATRAARRHLRLFTPWPHITLDDMVQDALLGILAAHYDLSRSAYGTFCYLVASRRIRDRWDACRARGTQIHLPADSPEHVAPPAARETDLLSAAESIPFPRRGMRGRPWRFDFRTRLEMADRRRRGESYGSIALRYGLRRSSVQRTIDSVRKIARRFPTAVAAE